MKNILFATDGSEASKGARNMATEYLRAWPESNLIVLYVTNHDAYAYDLVPEAVDKVESHMTEEIEKDTAAFFSSFGSRVQFAHRTGHAASTICAVSKEEEADLIILGSHGHGAIDSLLLGSVAHGVLNRVHVPVLVVRH